MEAERRQYTRKPIHTMIHIDKEPGISMLAQGNNVSVDGLSFNTADSTIKLNDVYTLAFDIPILGKPLRVQATARVVQKTFSGSDACRIGLIFTKLDMVSSWTLEAFARSCTLSFRPSQK